MHEIRDNLTVWFWVFIAKFKICVFPTIGTLGNLKLLQQNTNSNYFNLSGSANGSQHFGHCSVASCLHCYHERGGNQNQPQALVPYNPHHGGTYQLEYQYMVYKIRIVFTYRIIQIIQIILLCQKLTWFFWKLLSFKNMYWIRRTTWNPFSFVKMHSIFVSLAFAPF